jgi:arginine decarboxylase
MLKEILEWKMNEMAKLRGIRLKKIYYRIEELEIPLDHYGVCISAIIFLNEHEKG